MAKDKNTYAKRQRETLKRQKAEAKRARRRRRNEQPGSADASQRGDHLDGGPPLEPASVLPVDGDVGTILPLARQTAG